MAKKAAEDKEVKAEVKPAKVVKTPAQIETDTLASAEKKLVEKHGDKIVLGSARRSDDPRYGQKVMVDINTKGIDGDFDGGTRTVASSDVFQIHHSVEVAAQLRKDRASAKRAEKRAEREAAAPAVSVEEVDEALGL